MCFALMLLTFAGGYQGTGAAAAVTCCKGSQAQGYYELCFQGLQVHNALPMLSGTVHHHLLQSTGKKERKRKSYADSTGNSVSETIFPHYVCLQSVKDSCDDSSMQH